LEFKCAEVRKCIAGLNKIDFELAYLAGLTIEGIKPLSRWEKPIERDEMDLLLGAGLICRQVNRTVQTGGNVCETIFGICGGYLKLYEHAFANRPVDKSSQTQILEGYFFGYPPCCVNAFVRSPYASNSIQPADQEILFHWTCSDCSITPLLLEQYREVRSCILGL